MRRRNRKLSLLAALALAGGLAACSGKSPTMPGASGPPRSFRMGFSAIPPKADFALLLAALDMWTRRADAAILHVSPPWAALLDGVAPDSAVRLTHLDLANYYRAKSLELVVMLDATDGLNRAAEAPELVAAGRSITEPAVRQLYRDYAVAMDTLLHPEWMGLAAETNLIRAAAPAALYSALVQMVNDAAADVRAADAGALLYVSVQVETAWGRLTGSGVYEGIAADLADFPFLQAIGLSSYPYLGGFTEPEQVPLDYYARIAEGTSLPELVVEGGWASESVGAVISTRQKQARWIRRHVELLDRARAQAVFQLTFTDLSPTIFPPGSILPIFATLGLVDTALAAKPALAPWDSAFARPRS
jgi:hypothetical protein